MAKSFTNPLIPFQGDIESQPVNNLFNELLSYINEVFGPDELSFPSDGSANQALITNGSGTLSFTNLVRASTDFSISADGTNQQVLSTNGSGTLSFVDNESLTGWRVVSSNDNLADGDRVIVDTTGGVITLTLPSTPSTGDEVDFLPGDNTEWETTNFTVARNSSNIEGVAEDLTVDSDNPFRLVYVGATTGWRIEIRAGAA